jgi:hypothetical protein
MLETPAPLPSYEVAMNYVSDQAFALATNYTPQTTTSEAAPFLLPSAVPVPILTPPPTGANVSPEMTAGVAPQPASIAARLPAAVPTPEPAAAAIEAQLPTVVAVPSPRPPTMTMTFAKVGG